VCVASCVSIKKADRFAEKYGDRVLPLYSFVDYAVERGFELQGAAATP